VLGVNGCSCCQVEPKALSLHSCSVFVGINHCSGGVLSSKLPVLDKKCGGGPILR